ncbi:MAG: hypothetical protein GX876_08875 [Bacteroidales bacterium]|nr:hypothetical protein [Bacteroidales bacterium]
MRTRRYLILLFPAVVLAAGCRKIEHLPPEPKIEFRYFEVFDTTDILGNTCKGGRLNFYFEDGDGNLGLPPPDGTHSDTTNLFLRLFRKTEGRMTEVGSNDILRPSNYRIPYMDRTGQNKILRGTISVTFLYLFYSPESNDTVRYDFFIKDRDENISNTESTSEILLSENNIYKKTK